MLRRLVSPTNTRARIYDRDGVLILDSHNLYGRGDVLRFDLPPPNAEKPGIVERGFIALRRWFGRGDLPLYTELGPENGKGYPEVTQALNGQHASMVSVNDRGEVIVSVAVPVGVPPMTAASLAPWMVMSICWVVPSAVDTVTKSCNVPPVFSPWTDALPSSRV